MMFALSLLSVVLSSQLISSHVIFFPTEGPKFKGDRCVVNNGLGTCLPIGNCTSVYETFKGKPPTAICGYVGFQQLVCCPSNTETTTLTTVTERTTTPEKHSAIWKPFDLNSSIGEHSAILNDSSLEWGNEKTTTSEKPSVTIPHSGKSEAAVARAQCARYSYAPLTRYPDDCSACPIFGGKKVNPMEFTHMAAVGFNSTNGVIYGCGGSLISERFVLTAAHCIYHVEWGQAKWVRLGDTNLNRTNYKMKLQEVRIINRIKHPYYRKPFRYHDIALLELEPGVIFSSSVTPICLPYSEPDTGNEEEATAIGWGTVDFADDRGSSDLLKVTMKFVNFTRCNQSYHNYDLLPHGIIDDWLICAGGEPGKDTCEGDSGGPLMIRNRDYHNMHSIVGITSFGTYCGGVTPGVYIRVSNYIPWIVKIVWPNLL